MFGTKALRAAQHAVRTPSIKFIGKRTIPGMYRSRRTAELTKDWPRWLDSCCWPHSSTASRFAD